MFNNLDDLTNFKLKFDKLLKEKYVFLLNKSVNKDKVYLGTYLSVIKLNKFSDKPLCVTNIKVDRNLVLDSNYFCILNELRYIALDYDLKTGDLFPNEYIRKHTSEIDNYIKMYMNNVLTELQNKGNKVLDLFIGGDKLYYLFTELTNTFKTNVMYKNNEYMIVIGNKSSMQSVKGDMFIKSDNTPTGVSVKVELDFLKECRNLSVALNNKWTLDLEDIDKIVNLFISMYYLPTID